MLLRCGCGGWLGEVTTSTDTAAPGGFDSAFLVVAVQLPEAAPEAGLMELAYTHFTVLLHPVRRLAAATAVNIDGSSLRELDRVDEWRLDPRVRRRCKQARSCTRGTTWTAVT